MLIDGTLERDLLARQWCTLKHTTTNNNSLVFQFCEASSWCTRQWSMTIRFHPVFDAFIFFVFFSSSFRLEMVLRSRFGLVSSSFDRLSVISRLCFDNLSIIFRPCFDRVLDIFRSSFDYFLIVFRASFGHLSVAFRSSCGRVWTSFVCVSIVFGLSFDSLSIISWSSLNRLSLLDGILMVL